MPRLSWNEIEHRAVQFAARWEGETYEKGESQSFWSELLDIFGIDRRRHGAFFEYAIKKAGGGQGFIDLFWPGRLLAEQKSAGRSLADALSHACALSAGSTARWTGCTSARRSRVMPSGWRCCSSGIRS